MQAWEARPSSAPDLIHGLEGLPVVEGCRARPKGLEIRMLKPQVIQHAMATHIKILYPNDVRERES